MFTFRPTVVGSTLVAALAALFGCCVAIPDPVDGPEVAVAVPEGWATERDETAWNLLSDAPSESAPVVAREAGRATSHEKGAVRDDLGAAPADKKLEFAKNPKLGFSETDDDVFSAKGALAAMLADTTVYDAGAVQDQFCRRYAPKRWDVIEALPPVENQKAQGSCAAFASAYYGLHCLIKWRHIVDLREKLKVKAPEDQVAAVRAEIGRVNKRFSPAFVYNQINKGRDRGALIGDAFKLLAAHGCAQWDDMPYKDTDFTTQPPDTAQKGAGAWKGQIKRIWYIPRDTNLKVLKVFLSRGRPVVISLYVHKDFEDFKAPARDKAVYAPPKEQAVDHTKKEGWHALCLFGFNDERRAGASSS